MAPSRPSSRLNPQSFLPPKGACAVGPVAVLMPKWPNCNVRLVARHPTVAEAIEQGEQRNARSRGLLDWTNLASDVGGGETTERDVVVEHREVPRCPRPRSRWAVQQELLESSSAVARTGYEIRVDLHDMKRGRSNIRITGRPHATTPLGDVSACCPRRWSPTL